MRLWSLHPRYLDAKGLVALWREALLAQRVLAGKTMGFYNHPQLRRFRQQPDPLAAIAAYLKVIHEEATRRGYRFDAGKIAPSGEAPGMTVTLGQLRYELDHLKSRLALRDVAMYRQIATLTEAEPHPLFQAVAGDIEAWEVSGVRRQVGRFRQADSTE